MRINGNKFIYCHLLCVFIKNNVIFAVYANHLLLCPLSEEVVPVQCRKYRPKSVLYIYWRFSWNFVSERLLCFFFLKTKIWWILIIFSTKFGTKLIGSPHMADIGEICCDTAQKNVKIQHYSCAQEVRLFYEFNLLNMEISPHIKILQKFRV